MPFCLNAQGIYNHPEIDWQTIETEHFKIHFYDDTEILAREATGILEDIYPPVTELYQFEPNEKTHIIFTDTEDVANGIAYYYDNKIVIWASPLDIALRGSHKWLENVLTHEFVHIISIQKAMKAGRTFPGAYFQWIGYEEETRQNVLYGYPNSVVSYPVPGVAVPPWLAEGTAQFMYQDANWDNWDSHRAMLLRDRVIHNNMLTMSELNTFGKCGIGNESVYNTGYAFVNFIVDQFGAEALSKIMNELSKPFNYSIDKILEKVTGLNGKELYEKFSNDIKITYKEQIATLKANQNNIDILRNRGTANLYPKWSNDGKKIAYISNKENDFFSQTDLFIYDIGSGQEEKIAHNISYAATWGHKDDIIYYSKKPLRPDVNGYRYFDLYSYNFIDREETRLTRAARVTSPVLIENKNSIAYAAMQNGKQSIFLYSIENGNIEKLIDFPDRRILNNLYYDRLHDRILFDYTQHHFRNIAGIDLSSFEHYDIATSANMDERDICVANDGSIIYSNDKNGIFNLFSESEQIYFTNVSGGAFMPDVNDSGQIVFSLYDDGGHKIALLDSAYAITIDSIDIEHRDFDKPVNRINSDTAVKYRDNFAQMFIIPRIMIDYGTIKPGLYFYSSEILDKLSLSGGMTINFDKDTDFGFNLTYRKLYPTIYTGFMYSTRNTIDQTKYSVYEIDDKLKFRFVLMQFGLQFPIFGSKPLELYSRWQRYRAFIKQNVDAVNLKSGYAYDYFRGFSTGIKYGIDFIKMTVDRDINPSDGFKLFTEINYEMNDFIEGLNLSDSGTLVEDFEPNNYLSINMNCAYYFNIYPAKRWTLGVSAKGGWISNKDVDSFFYYFGGGMDGIQGYPYYSFEGTNTIYSEISFRIPVLRLNHIPIGWTIWQNATIGLEYQVGDTWSEDFDLKQSIGLQFRLNGFSFYNYPTAIGFEIHRGLTEFELETEDEILEYGSENRYYLSILFGF